MCPSPAARSSARLYDYGYNNFSALYRQLLLHSLTLQFGHLPLVTLLQDLVHFP